MHNYPFFFTHERTILEIVKGVPHCANLRVAGEHQNGDKLLVLDRVGNRNLHSIASSNKGLLEHEVLKLIKNMLECLDSLMQKGVINGDIKPSNIVYGNGSYTLVDFGLSQLTKNTVVSHLGTFMYGSPEVYLNLAPDFTADIWSLGCTIFFAYTGDHLFNSKASFFEKLKVRSLILKKLLCLIELEEVVGEIPLSIIKSGIGKVEDGAIDLSNKNSRLIAYLFLKEMQRRGKEIPPLEDIFEKEELNALMKKSEEYFLPSAEDLLKANNGIKRSTLNERLKDFPLPIKKLIENCLSYENSPTPKELLDHPSMKRDVGFKVDFKKELKGYTLAIAPIIENPTGRSFGFETLISQDMKWCGKKCHHIIRSPNDQYRVRLVNPDNRTVFSGEISIHEGETLQIS